MKISPAGLKFLEQNEGRVLTVYRDVSGNETVGVGHRLLHEDQLALGDTITQEQCDAFLAHDVAKCENAINLALAEEIEDGALSQNEFDALVSLTFNIGVAGFISSTVLADIKAGNVADEDRAFRLWDKDLRNGVKVVDEALLARRDREVALFLKPDGQT